MKITINFHILIKIIIITICYLFIFKVCYNKYIVHKILSIINNNINSYLYDIIIFYILSVVNEDVLLFLLDSQENC